MDIVNKINISVPISVKQQLDEDAMLFEIYKKDGETINRNGFLNRLIKGYYHQYVQEQESLRCQINDVLMDDYLTSDVMDVLNSRISTNKDQDYKEHSVIISLKPRRDTSHLIQSIIGGANDPDASHPKNLKTMFAYYLAEPLYKREQFIFKESYDNLISACKDGSQLRITTRFAPETVFSVLPYKVVVGGERSNYLLCQKQVAPELYDTATFRINRITSIVPERKTMEFSPEIIRYLDRMNSYSPSYSIHSDAPIIICMDKDMYKKYKMISYDRPPYTRKDGNIYYFDCSEDQAFVYFRKLGGVCVISPDTLSTRLKDFHQEAINYLGISPRAD